MKKQKSLPLFLAGYLPKSNKEIITKPTTTKQALDGLLPHLVKEVALF